MKRILCLVGESGSGKTTIAEILERNYGYKVLPSYTTRPKRTEEEKHHTFVTPEAFAEQKPHMVAYTRFNDYEYGATTHQVLDNDIYVIDLVGLASLEARMGRHSFYAVHVLAAEDTRKNRMFITRGLGASTERIEHDRQAFAGISTSPIQLTLPNEDAWQLRLNVRVLNTILRYLHDH